jgi:hypothetical protein
MRAMRPQRGSRVMIVPYNGQQLAWLANLKEQRE